MKRDAEDDLKLWFASPQRMPMILRGARQVGKSTLVRLFCEKQGLELIELNLEKVRLKSTKTDNFELPITLDEIQLQTKKTISSSSLLFLDEIQEDPILLSRLRYFFEERPDIAVIAAGSLLEMAIHDANFSFPVGRVQFYHLGPMTFSEYLLATGNQLLNEKIQALDFSETVRSLALTELRKFYYIGGMPKAIQTYLDEKSLVPVRAIQEQIIQTYVADFPKYGVKSQTDKMQRIFYACCQQLGKKVIYQKLDPELKSRDIKKMIELLVDAKILLKCHHSNANAVPLAAESDLSVFKLYFLDVGLVNALMRLDLEVIDQEFENHFSTKGFLAEQFVAQHLALFSGPHLPPELFYWLRDKDSQKGEIDFLVQDKDQIVPLEVKSTRGTHLKSMFYFSREKKSKRAIKFSLDPYATEELSLNIQNERVSFELTSIPHFAIGALRKILG